MNCHCLKCGFILIYLSLVVFLIKYSFLSISCGLTKIMDVCYVNLRFVPGKTTPLVCSVKITVYICLSVPVSAIAIVDFEIW